MPCDSCARAGKVQVAQYRCPACARCSCSLACVKDHKTHYGCTGVRDKSAPVPKRDYNEHQVISDYSVLEEAKRKHDDVKRNRITNKVARPAAKKNVFDPIPRYKQVIMGEEAAQRGIDLRFMPPHFFRHRNNTSHVKPVDYCGEGQAGATRRPFERIMVWRVDIHFCGPGGGTRLVQIHDLDEDVNMADLLERAVQKLEMRKEPRLNGDVDQYLLYAGMSGSNLNAYLRNDSDLGRRRAEPSILPDLPSHKRRKLEDGSADPTAMDVDTRGFIPIDTDNTLRESLHGAMVVEYPILFVAPKGSSDDDHLQSATKSLFMKPEREVDDTFPCPALPTADVQADEGQRDCDQTDARMSDANESEAPQAGSAQNTGGRSAVHNPSHSNSNSEKVEIEAKPVTNQSMPSDSQVRGQKRKADDSGDSESEMSELEKNIVRRLTPRKMNGGKTGYSCEGKLKVVEPKKLSPVAFSMPKFRSVLPPVGYDKGDVRDEKDVQAGWKDQEADRRKGADFEESESGSENDSAEEEGSNVDNGVAGEDSEQMNEDFDDDESFDEADKSDGDEKDNESDRGSDENEEVNLEDEQEEEREEYEAVSKKLGEDGSPGQKRARHSATQDRPRPLKRRRFEDLEAVELRGEESVAEEREDEQVKASERDEVDEIAEDGDNEKKTQRAPAVSSPPPPFLQVDSVLLETRIPRRKKMPDQNGREPLIC